jgi:hypothetical protein
MVTSLRSACPSMRAACTHRSARAAFHLPPVQRAGRRVCQAKAAHARIQAATTSVCTRTKPCVSRIPQRTRLASSTSLYLCENCLFPRFTLKMIRLPRQAERDKILGKLTNFEPFSRRRTSASATPASATWSSPLVPPAPVVRPQRVSSSAVGFIGRTCRGLYRRSLSTSTRAISTYAKVVTSFFHVLY